MVIPAQVGAQNINKDSVKNPIPQVNALDSIAVKDLSERSRRCDCGACPFDI